MVHNNSYKQRKSSKSQTKRRIYKFKQKGGELDDELNRESDDQPKSIFQGAYEAGKKSLNQFLGSDNQQTSQPGSENTLSEPFQQIKEQTQTLENRSADLQTQIQELQDKNQQLEDQLETMVQEKQNLEIQLTELKDQLEQSSSTAESDAVEMAVNAFRNILTKNMPQEEDEESEESDDEEEEGEESDDEEEEGEESDDESKEVKLPLEGTQIDNKPQVIQETKSEETPSGMNMASEETPSGMNMDSEETPSGMNMASEESSQQTKPLNTGLENPE